MKAKVKETGKVIDVELDMNAQPLNGTGSSLVYKDSDGKKYYNTELDFSNVYPDWQNIRIQAAIAVVQGAWANPHNGDDCEEIAKWAEKQADDLISELKKQI